MKFKNTEAVHRFCRKVCFGVYNKNKIACIEVFFFFFSAINLLNCIKIKQAVTHHNPLLNFPGKNGTRNRYQGIGIFSNIPAKSPDVPMDFCKDVFLDLKHVFQM